MNMDTPEAIRALNILLLEIQRFHTSGEYEGHGKILLLGRKHMYALRTIHPRDPRAEFDDTWLGFPIMPVCREDYFRIVIDAHNRPLAIDLAKERRVW